MSKPGYCLGLTRASRVLEEVILRGVVDEQVVDDLADGAQLVVTREDWMLNRALFACDLILLLGGFHKDKLADEVVNGIFGKDVFPHVGHGISVFVDGVALARVDAFATTDIEWQEICFELV